MKLRRIGLAGAGRRSPGALVENISRSDFFDLYSLIAAYQEPNLKHGDPEHSREVQRRLAYEARLVFKDQMDQLFCIIANRLMEPDPDNDNREGASTLPLFRQHGIPLENGGEPGPDGLPGVDRAGIAATPYRRRAEFLQTLVAFRQQHGTGQWFTGTDGRWAGLALKYGELANVGPDLQSLVNAIDRIYGLVHHGGMLADYFDEKGWLEDALHIRSAGDPSQFLRYASSDVRQLLRTAAHGSYRPEVSELQKLRVALQKLVGKYGRVSAGGDGVQLRVQFSGWLVDLDGRFILSVVPGEEPHKWMVTAQQAGKHVRRLGSTAVDCRLTAAAGQLRLQIGDRQLGQDDLQFYNQKSDRPSQVAYQVVDQMRQEAIRAFDDQVPEDTMRF